MADGVLRRLTAVGADLVDLVLPVGCAGCGAERVPLRYGACDACAAELESLRPFSAAPVPVPAGMPPCVALGGYAGVLRQTLLSFKERGRHRLAAPLGTLLAGPVAAAAGPVAAGRFVVAAPTVPVVVVPVPSTGRAARQRHGDHVARLAAHCVRRMRDSGWQARVIQPLRALPRADSVQLDGAGRAAAARASLRLRPNRVRSVRRAVDQGGAMVVVIDDIVTTGSTLAAVAECLALAAVPVAAAAVLAATTWRSGRPGGTAVLAPDGARWAIRRDPVLRTRDDWRASAS